MTENEKINRAIHAVVSGCDHEWCDGLGHIDCKICFETPIDFLDIDQPHSRVVRMVRAFVDKFGNALPINTLPIILPADQIARALATMVEDL